jgi:hypothetical protein
MAKKTGTSTGGIETSSAYAKKQRRRRAAEERRWEDLSGPIILRFGDTAYYLKSDVVRADLKRIRNAILGGGAELQQLVDEGVVRPGT